MNPGLIERRASLVATLDKSRAAGMDSADLFDLERLIQELDRLIRAQSPPVPKVKAKPARTAATGTTEETLLAIPRDRSEVRVRKGTTAGQGWVDIRVWYPSQEAGELVPSRSGLRLSVEELAAVMGALEARRP